MCKTPNLLFIGLLFANTVFAESKVRFNRDIRPIMSETCFRCHGPDKNARKGDLRLDLRGGVLKPAKSGDIPIVPGRPAGSLIIDRILTADEDDLMPPEKTHKVLTPAQKDLFRRWVAEGAAYEAHWAYTPLVKPELPKIDGAKFSPRNAIDRFIAAKLIEKKVNAPSPAADARMLIRRVTRSHRTAADTCGGGGVYFRQVRSSL